MTDCKCRDWASRDVRMMCLTGHHEDCPNRPDPVEKLKEIISELCGGIEAWAADEDGVHDAAFAAYERARAIVPRDLDVQYTDETFDSLRAIPGKVPDVAVEGDEQRDEKKRNSRKGTVEETGRWTPNNPTTIAWLSSALRDKFAECERLREQLDRLRRELGNKDESLARKNRELDALHHVWCSGGCEGGVHRWQEKPLTLEIVEEAERNTKRLRQWWESHVHHARRESTVKR